MSSIWPGFLEDKDIDTPDILGDVNGKTLKPGSRRREGSMDDVEQAWTECEPGEGEQGGQLSLVRHNKAKARINPYVDIEKRPAENKHVLSDLHVHIAGMSVMWRMLEPEKKIRLMKTPLRAM